jgi:DNA-directed RNA polymerase II subunit RPB4
LNFGSTAQAHIVVAQHTIVVDHRIFTPQSLPAVDQVYLIPIASDNMANTGGPAPAPHMISRPKRAPTGDEEATAILRLGEFQQVPALNLSEARTIINAVTTRRRNIKQKVSESETLLKTQEYLELFARFKQQEHVTAVEQLLTTRTELERFERSQLGEFT